MASFLQKTVLCVLSGAVVVLLVPIGMRIAVSRHIHRADDAPRVETILVLGASVVRGAPSPILAERADTAIELYRAGRGEKILVSGDSRHYTHDEVTSVYDYLVGAAIPNEHIVLDHEGFDTYTSMYRARHVYGIDSLLIVTQDFHLPRALWIAQWMGIDAEGVVAGTRGSFYDYLREIPASIKALIDVVVRRVPADL